MKYLLALLSVCMIVSCQTQTEENVMESPEELTLLVGTYTARESEGIYMYKFNPETGDSRLVNVTKGLNNPSFLALSPNKKNVYAVSEIEGGSVVSLALGDSTLTEINIASSGGVHPCHITTDKSGKWVLTGNYSSGSLAVLPILENGGVGAPVQEISHKGKGPNKERQEAPHVHSVNVSPNNMDVFVPDLGIDKVMAYRLDAATGQLTEGKSMSVSAGSGPRHLTFHPNGKFAYVVQELTGAVTAFKYSDEGLETIEEVSTLPEDFDGKNSSADIHISPDGKFLYASNRFVDTIAIFSIDKETGKLTELSHHSALGQMPRNFVISPSGKFILVANQESDNIVIFDRDEVTGKISPTNKEIKVSMPVCLLFVD
ncbi:lactonase family protein [uncultured Arcticibacterium sp.]|uniref:lactonase family protein n=1 Tax=uncultured Arcticibacterium sp. TaxID=2173042 RepID=UPI0030F9EDEE